MSGSVLVLPEPIGFVVGCFNTACPEHGDGTAALPWMGDYAHKIDATKAAAEHRAFIRGHWEPANCHACGQRIPAPTHDLPETSEEPDDE